MDVFFHKYAAYIFCAKSKVKNPFTKPTKRMLTGFYFLIIVVDRKIQTYESIEMD
jgi:hypothetical protein